MKAQRRAPAKRSTFLGLPGSWQWPGWDAIFANIWNTKPSAKLFPAKVFGFGWSFNFAYARIKSKPFWARVGAFLLGLLFTLIVVYALLCFCLVAYFLLTKQL